MPLYLELFLQNLFISGEHEHWQQRKYANGRRDGNEWKALRLGAHQFVENKILEETWRTKSCGIRANNASYSSAFDDNNANANASDQTASRAANGSPDGKVVPRRGRTQASRASGWNETESKWPNSKLKKDLRQPYVAPSELTSRNWFTIISRVKKWKQMVVLKQHSVECEIRTKNRPLDKPKASMLSGKSKAQTLFSYSNFEGK